MDRKNTGRYFSPLFYHTFAFRGIHTFSSFFGSDWNAPLILFLSSLFDCRFDLWPFSIRRFTIRRKASSDCWIIFSPHQRDRVLHPACCFNLHSRSLSYEYFLESTLDRWVFNG